MPTITRDMVRELNNRLEVNGVAVRIVDRDYPDALYDHNLVVEPRQSDVAPLVIDRINYTNCGETDQEVTAGVKKTLTNEITTTFTLGTKVGTKFEVDVGLAGFEMTVEMDLEASQETKTAEEVEFDISYPLAVGSMRRVIFQAIVQMEKVKDVPFILLVFLKGGPLLAVPSGLLKVRRYLQAGGGEWAGDHMYATGVEHPEDSGYVEEGSPGYVFDHESPGTVALVRYFNGVDHFLTVDPAEVTDPRLRKEGPIGYVYPDAQPDTVPFYRYFNGRDHFYTTDYNELGEARGSYKLEGIAGHIVPTSVAEGGAPRDVTELLPNLDDRRFEIRGTFNGESTARDAEITLLESSASVDECNVLKGKLGGAPGTEGVGKDLFEIRAPEGALMVSQALDHEVLVRKTISAAATRRRIERDVERPS